MTAAEQAQPSRPPDFVVLHPLGEITYCRRMGGESITDAIGHVVDDLDSEPFGSYRVWFSAVSDDNLPPPNPLAERVLRRLDYSYGRWDGVVALSMEAVRGETPPLTPELREIIDEIAERTTPHPQATPRVAEFGQVYWAGDPEPTHPGGPGHLAMLDDDDDIWVQWPGDARWSSPTSPALERRDWPELARDFGPLVAFALPDHDAAVDADQTARAAREGRS